MSQPPPDEPSQKPPQQSPRGSPALRALTAAEVVGIASELQRSLVGAQIQDCIQTPSELGLGFYHSGEMLWLWFDLQPLRPLVVRINGKPPARKKIQRPLTLFLRSRFFGRRLASVTADPERGRILIFSFHRGRAEETTEETAGPCEIEARLFPHGQNIIARDGEKLIAENKPKDPPPAQLTSSTDTARSWSDIEDAWRGEQGARPKGVDAAKRDAQSIERDWQRAIEKKEKAIERMKDELAAKTSMLPALTGEWLKANGTLEVPSEFASQIDRSKSLSWNIEECFRRAKDNARKSAGTRARIAAVENELARLRSGGPSRFDEKRDQGARKEAENLLTRAEARGRRHQLADDLEVYVGKSASDNLALLRRAQPFDYWLHLRERPGSHAIMRRTRSRQVSDAEFAQAGRWVVEQSTGKRASELKGERFDLLIVECRFVRPIKGDKQGRVNYLNDRVLTLRF